MFIAIKQKNTYEIVFKKLINDCDNIILYQYKSSAK